MAAGSVRIDPELFEEWKAHPITELMFRALARHSAHVRDVWAESAWLSGVCDPTDLIRKRERAAVLSEVMQMTPETIEEWLK